MRRIVAILILSLAPFAAIAQDVLVGDEVEALFAKARDFMATERETLMPEELALTSSEADAFWPIYEAYRDEIEALNDEYAALLQNFADGFATMTDAEASAMIDEYFLIESGLIYVRQRYAREFLEAIPPRKLVRLYQMENKIDAMAQLPLIIDIPLLQDAGDR
ncbi:MAG: hypothetical protein GWN29_09740 [Gammaproteobacteria bacterium]|nr:hypothetical protein [Gammaproteobacteria bacterium]